MSVSLPKLTEVKLEIPLFPKDVILRSYPAYLAVVIRHTGATTVWVLLPVYLVQQLDFAESIVGYVYACNAFVQFFVMMVVDRLPPKYTISFGLILSTLCFATFDHATQVWHWAVILSFVGMAWAFLFVGGTVYVMDRCVERATATGILQGCMSLAGMTGPLIGGIVAEVFEYRFNFYIAVCLCLVSLVLFVATYPRVERYIIESEQKGSEIAHKEEE